MAIATSFYSISLNDNTINPKSGDPEFSTTEFPLTLLTAANLAAQTTLLSNLKTALLALVMGNTRQDVVTQSRPIISTSRPSSTEAQREKKWVLRAHGATSGQKAQYRIGTADLSLLDDGQEFLDMTGTEAAAFKTAFDAVVHNKNDQSELMVLDSIQYVGARA